MYRKLPKGISCLLLSALFAVSTLLIPQIANAQPTNAKNGNTTLSSLVQGTVATASGGAAGTFSGVFKATNFVAQNGQLAAQGVLTGTITNPDGTTTPVTNQAVTAPVASASGSCAILNLTLGPLNLNVLGLVITLNQVNLNIVAQPGAGNLLGNLLCSVAGLLNGGGALATIVTDLNNIIGILAGL